MYETMMEVESLKNIRCNKYRKFPKVTNIFEKLGKLLGSKQTLSSSDSALEIHNGSWSSKERRSQLGNFIRIYFNFMYYLGACPFKIVKDVGTGYYYAKTGKGQQIACASLTILGFIRLVAYIRSSLPDNISSLNTKNPIPYFRILLALFHLICQCSLTKRFWVNIEEYVAVLNLIEREGDLPVGNTKTLSPYLSYAMYGFTALELVVSLLVGLKFVEPISTWTPSWWLRRLVALSQYTFWIGEKVTPNLKVTPRLSDVTFWEWVLTMITLVGEFRRSLLYLFADFCILASALTLWVTARSFSLSIEETMKFDGNGDAWQQREGKDNIQKLTGHFKKVRKHRNQPVWSVFYRNFQAIYSLSQSINIALGSQVTWYMAVGLMYYSTNIHYVLFATDEFRRMRLIIFYIITGCILYISADICYQLETIRCWLLKHNNLDGVRNEEAILVLHALDSADVGIRGSNLITLTYQLVAGYLSLIVTFFIISLQQNDLEHNP